MHSIGLFNIHAPTSVSAVACWLGYTVDIWLTCYRMSVILMGYNLWSAENIVLYIDVKKLCTNFIIISRLPTEHASNVQFRYWFSCIRIWVNTSKMKWSLSLYCTHINTCRRLQRKVCDRYYLCTFCAGCRPTHSDQCILALTLYA